MNYSVRANGIHECSVFLFSIYLDSNRVLDTFLSICELTIYRHVPFFRSVYIFYLKFSSSWIDYEQFEERTTATCRSRTFVAFQWTESLKNALKLVTFHFLLRLYFPYLNDRFLPGRRALRSAGSSRLHIPHVKLPTVGTRVFSVAGPRIWNNLPDHITSDSAGSLHTFCHRMKTYLFQRTYS